MQTGTPSRTAMATALMRAIHSRADPLPLIDDPWGDRLLAPVREIIDARSREAGFSDADAYLRNGAAYANVIIRARFAEDALARARSRGVGQYVIIGAGFDCYALRQPPGEPLVIYEVDHPATQTYKRRRLSAAGVEPPQNLRFVAADLGQQRLGDALARAGYDANSPAFFAWLGVTMYLTREANLATFSEIARIGARDSELVFTYTDAQLFHPDERSPKFQRLLERVGSIGEPIITGFDPARMADELAACGLALIEDVGADELIARYDALGRNGLGAERYSRVARARVA